MSFSDQATLEVSGLEINMWDAYSLESDLMTPADGFSFVLPMSSFNPADRRDVLDIIRAAPTVKVYVGREVPGHSVRSIQMTGIITNLSMESSRDGGSKLRIKGTDLGGLLTTSSANPSLVVGDETEFVTFVRTLCAPYGITVITESNVSRSLLSGHATDSQGQRRQRAARAAGLTSSAGSARTDARSPLSGGRALDEGRSTEASRARARRGHASGLTGSDIERLRISEAKPQVGETIWDFIDRHAKRFGVLAWMDPRGRLQLSSPNYDQPPMQHLRRLLRPTERANNIVSGGFEQDLGKQPSEVTVFGRSRGHDATRSAFKATVANNFAAVPRPLTVHDNSVRSVEEAERRARREMAKLAQDAFVLEYEVRDHGEDHYLYCVDSIVDVQDEAIGVSGPYYVVSRTFEKSRENGTTTRLRLIPPGSLAL